MKHAYLIIAHNEPEILKLLVSSIDDERNDIYVHVDKKAAFSGDILHVSKSNLHVLRRRMDARWGDFSLVEVELSLFHEAYNNGLYEYYHLLSGVDLPIKSQSYIHDYCDHHPGIEYIGFAQNVAERELRWRSQHYFIFSKSFNSKNFFIRAARAFFVSLQSLARYKRIPCEVKKGCQWCSVTGDFVNYLLSKETYIRNYFNHTYCPDELVIQTLCWNSHFKERVYTADDEFKGCKRFIKWIDGSLHPISIEDKDYLLKSESWFARKFSKDVYDFAQTMASLCSIT